MSPNFTTGRNPFVQLIILVILSLGMHALVLTLIFPGYYSPLTPYHSDFYIPAALANSPHDFFQYRYLGYSRPLGIFFIKMIGFLGLRGGILFTIINVAVNASLSAILLRLVLNIPFTARFAAVFCLYSYLLYSHPYFYTFYTQDILSHLSYFFLITGAYLFYRGHAGHKTSSFVLLCFFSIIAFLCKETYGISAIALSFLWYVYHRRSSSQNPFAPLLATGIALILVVVFNLVIKSVFINFRSSSSDPYFINLTPASVFRESGLYLKEGFNALNYIILVITGLICVLYLRKEDKKAWYVIPGCILAAFLSLIPNALIPNHHNGGYSFNGAYLFYLPLLFIPVLWQRKERMAKGFALAMLLAALLSPALNQNGYAAQGWVLEQEATERRLLNSLDLLFDGLRPSEHPRHILVAGLTMPFFPFHHPLFLKEYRNSKFAVYDVVDYAAEAGPERENSVKFIKPKDVKMENYDAVWMFAGNGSLIDKLPVDPAVTRKIMNNNCLNSIIYPDSTKNQELLSILK